MKSATRTFDVCGFEFEVEFEATPYSAARISGPPEYCYPAEGGDVDIISIALGDWEVTDILSEDILEKIQAAVEAYVCSDEPMREAAADLSDYLYESARDEALYA